MAFNFRDHLLPGSAADALQWVRDSELPATAQQKLAEFVNRFPSLEFYRNDDAILDKKEEIEGVTLPQWFRRMRKTLAYVLPQEIDVQFQVDSCDGWTPREDDMPGNWYSLGMVGYSNDDQRRYLVEAGSLFPIGYGGQETLAISLEYESSSVFEFNEEDLMDNMSEGTPPGASAYKIFDAYEDLLAHIVAFKLPDGRIVRALGK